MAVPLWTATYEVSCRSNSELAFPVAPSESRASIGEPMTKPSTATLDWSNDPREELRNLLMRALLLMDQLRPTSIPAARLQQILDEFDENFLAGS